MATLSAFNRNLPYLNQQFKALLGNTSPAVKFICIVTVSGYILSFSETAVRVLSISPGYLLPPSFWIWTAFTFCFLEIYFWEVLVDIATVGLCGKLIEPLWGQMEMLTFFGIVNLGVAVLTSFYYLFYYMCTKNTDILFDIHIHGLAGYVAGVCVSVRQIMPDHLIARTPIGKFTNRNIPMTLLFASIILWAIGLLDGTHPVMFCSGLIVSWVYLRFYQRHPNGSRGDSSENFTFSSFFPNVLQPFVSILVNPIYKLCVRIGIIKALSGSRSNATSLSSVAVSMPGVDQHDMERRRQIALKALSERLSRTTDSSRQKLLPKSFPPPKLGGHQSSKNHHHHLAHHPSPSSVLSSNSSTNLQTKENKKLESTIVNVTQTPNTPSSSNLIELDSQTKP